MLTESKNILHVVCVVAVDLLLELEIINAGHV